MLNRETPAEKCENEANYSWRKMSGNSTMNRYKLICLISFFVIQQTI